MSWRRGEIWLDFEPRWFREVTEGGAVLFETNAPSFTGLTLEALTAAIPDGLAQSRRRRAELRRRRTARKTQAAALVIGPAVALSLAAPRLGSASRTAELLEVDPPSQTLPPGPAEVEVVEERPLRAEQESRFPAVRWSDATSHGVPFAGSLSNGTQLPVEGPGWITWNPVTDSVPNRPGRLYGNDHVIRKLLQIIAAHHGANPNAPPVVVGDLSFRGGGRMELHRSHQNGLDVDVYYPRRDRAHRAPTRADQVHRRLTQDLVDRFVAAGAEKIFVGYATGVHGPGDVVIPYGNHEDHMHVRFPRPGH